jgi:uncharacterized protein
MSQFIDRRLNGKNKNAVNRQRFLRRYKKQIKEAVSNAIAKRGIEEIEQGEQISIPAKDIQEPTIGVGKGGHVEKVFPGNTDFVQGDRIERPQQEGGAGNGDGEASDQGEGMDDFVFEISREEFLELYFDDLALPDLIKKKIAMVPNYKYLRAGFTTSGVPTNINITRSMRQATARRMALANPYRRQLKEAEEQLDQLIKEGSGNQKLVLALEEKISALKKKIATVPFIDDIDIRYNNKVKQSSPSTQAVMFCVMDVSGSMDERKKDVAKRFFILLYLFLTRSYQNIKIVFIRHHTSAKEVEEEEFFYSRETGGTVVSSALVMLNDIIQSRFPTSDWNIYVAQASDGDNWNADSPYCNELLNEKIMPFVQYYAYIEIMPRHHQSLWESYLNVKARYDNFSMESIDSAQDIYPVFRELFKKELA